MKRLCDFGEDSLVARLASLLSSGRRVLVGPGDDCAVVAGEARGQVGLLKTDCLVEGVHYLPETPARRVGRKAVARVLSDFAAMGASRHHHLLVTLALPPDRPVRWVEDLYRGMDKIAVEFGALVVGGETSSVPPGAPAVVSVAASAVAERRRVVLRSHGRDGDQLLVTGRLGRSHAGRHLTFTPRLVEAGWLTDRFRVHAMMDLSDGLAKDLPRLARASGCGFHLDRDSLPRTRGATVGEALGDGEDYELLIAVSARTCDSLMPAWKKRFPKLKLTRIGVLDARADTHLEGGWDHFTG